ncbi:MAG: glycosyltransferase family 39 protein, partial [Planctomycetota bacterium]
MKPNHESAVPPATPARDAALIVALAAVMLFPSWPFRDLWTPDEPRYMEVAREMVLTGDYLVPHLNGETYPDKPPVFFWLAAGFYKLGFGYNSGRLVAALAAIGTLLVVLAFARRTMPRPGPLISALATLT